MLEKLSYSATFPTTGRTLKGDHDFARGFGVITGPNEAGKSFIIEVARWCLFGSAALRGKAEDYKSLTASLTFSMKGERYCLERTYTTAKLSHCGTVLCTGSRPVNDHVPKLLGFGLDVFDVACAANQGDIERLGNLKPAERKRMVDSVIGLDRLEELAKWCGDEAKVRERQIVDPGEEPVPPEEKFDEAALADARAAHEEMHQLKGVLSVGRSRPVEPTCAISQNVNELKPLAEAEQTKKAELCVLKKLLQALPHASPYSNEELDAFEQQIAAWDLWQRKQQFERKHPRPSHPGG